MHAGPSGSVLLFAYWLMSLPLLGEKIGFLTGLYSSQRNMMFRLIEPLGAIEDDESEATAGTTASPSGESSQSARRNGVQIRCADVRVQISGHVLLDRISLTIEAGSHVAVAGTSGAGKTSLVGLFLGWQRPASGQVLVDGVPLVGSTLDRLRSDTAWVDPGVHLWNRSLLENVLYGHSSEDVGAAGQAIRLTDLGTLLETLPEGLQTNIGESGGRLSGGEGQRARLARAMLRLEPGLIILDEPFRGLDRRSRSRLLALARRLWQRATLLCVTHDIAATLTFNRVLVLDGGSILEDGNPSLLAAQPGSRHRAMLEAEKDVGSRLWGGDHWERFRLEGGQLVPAPIDAEDDAPQTAKIEADLLS